jgi:erythromycin esterase-like protein
MPWGARRSRSGAGGSKGGAREADVLRAELSPIEGAATDYDPLLRLVGDASVVLLGEATHGTHEFYRERARITQRLVEEKGFTVVAVEADWPDAYRVNRWVRGHGDDADAIGALSGFQRFPTWMWRNHDVVQLVNWLRGYNETRVDPADHAGFYGLDLYSMYSSIDAVLRYLDDTDPDAAGRARYRYACFEHFDEDSQAYGYAAEFGLSASCEDAAVEQLRELVRLGASDGERLPDDERFQAEQNARLVRNAEEYYRTMFRGRTSSWNLRDRHMADTLEAILAHATATRGRPAKAVVWEHNSHIGDARATEMGEAGEWNVGQLTRERLGRDAVLVGLTTHRGTVTAASEWGGHPELKRVRDALDGSYEDVLHGLDAPAFYLPLRGADSAAALPARRLERAIGVIYLPRSERVSHYFHARIAEQFDALLHFDDTRAVEPLDPGAVWSSGELPETFPTGL